MTQSQEQKPGSGNDKIISAVTKIVSMSNQRTEKKINETFAKIKEQADSASQKADAAGKKANEIENKVKNIEKQVSGFDKFKTDSENLLLETKNVNEEAKKLLTDIKTAMESGAFKPTPAKNVDSATIDHSDARPEVNEKTGTDPRDDLRRAAWGNKIRPKDGTKQTTKAKNAVSGFKAAVDARLEAYAIKHAPKFKIIRNTAIAIGSYIAAIGPVFSGIKAMFKGGSLFGTIGFEYESLFNSAANLVSSVVTNPFSLAFAGALGYAAVKVYKTMKSEYAVFKAARDKGEI
ncbi:MAG: hypothetical protein WC506_02920 [Candidatus Micrarchaeia archaeon]